MLISILIANKKNTVVYLFVNRFKPAITGGEKYNEALIEGLHAAQLRASVHEGVATTYKKFNRLILNNFKNLFSVFTVSSPDIILFDNGYYAHIFLAIIVARYLKKCKIVMILLHFAHGELSPKNPKYFIVRWAEKMISAQCNFLIAISLYSKNLFCALTPGNSDVPFVVLNPFIASKKQAMQKSICDDRPLRFLQVGTIEKRKNVINVIRAAERLKFPYEIFFVGEIPESAGEYAKEVAATIEGLKLTDRVFLKGRASDEELLEYYKTSDVFILVSEYEGYGMVYAEAMQYGLPIIGTTRGAVPDLVHHGVNGVLCNPEDLDAIASAMDMMKNKEEFARFSKNNGADSQKFLSRDEFIKKTADVFLGNISPVNI